MRERDAHYTKQAHLLCTDTFPLIPPSLLSLCIPHTVIPGQVWVSGATMRSERGRRRNDISFAVPPIPLICSYFLLLLRSEQRQCPVSNLHLCWSFGTWRGRWGSHSCLPSTSPSHPEVHQCWPCQELFLLIDVCSLEKSEVLLHLMPDRAH